jgi:DNA-binding winged helix-turn-helix (wHTH) protein
MGESSVSNTGWSARFGLFELDTKAGELRKQGKRIRLQEQPLQVLTALVQRAGEIVSREELRQRLWPGDTFVDFDHSLNTAVNKLRDVLGDSAGSPRFVETVARKGYRFIAPVRREDAGTAPTEATANTSEQASPSPSPAELLHPELDVPVPRRGLTRGLFGLAQLMYLVFYLAALFHLRGVQNAAESFLPGWEAIAIVACVMVTAGVGIPLRLYLMSAVAFDHRGLGEKFRQMFPIVLGMDQLWAVAPFLLVPQIGLGAAFAAAAALLYLPFSERTLIRMAYLENR